MLVLAAWEHDEFMVPESHSMQLPSVAADCLSLLADWIQALHHSSGVAFFWRGGRGRFMGDVGT
jgi:hypothetical protein